MPTRSCVRPMMASDFSTVSTAWPHSLEHSTTSDTSTFSYTEARNKQYAHFSSAYPSSPSSGTCRYSATRPEKAAATQVGGGGGAGHSQRLFLVDEIKPTFDGGLRQNSEQCRASVAVAALLSTSLLCGTPQSDLYYDVRLKQAASPACAPGTAVPTSHTGILLHLMRH